VKKGKSVFSRWSLVFSPEKMRVINVGWCGGTVLSEEKKGKENTKDARCILAYSV